MSFTRFHDDPARIQKQLQESTDQGNYMINVPGNGTHPCFMTDPYIRMQKWGANLHRNPIALENDLRGMNQRYCRDSIAASSAENAAYSHSVPNEYPICNTVTEQPRADNPAWMLRGLENSRTPQHLLEDPQTHTSMPFECYVHSRIVEKDQHTTVMPSLKDD